jgi:transposase
MESGKRKARRELSPEEKWELFLEVTSQEISQADAARKYGVDVSVIVRLRALAQDAALAAFVSAKPGRPVSAEAVESGLLRAENDRLSEALKVMAIELTLHRGLSPATNYLQCSLVCPAQGGVRGRCTSDNQSWSRNAITASLGWYRPGAVPIGVMRSIASCLIVLSACR